MTQFKTILVPTDFEPASDAAIETAIQLATAFGGSIRLVNSYEIPMGVSLGPAVAPFVNYTPMLEKISREALDAQAGKYKMKFERIDTVLRCGVPWREILAAAEEDHADTIVMGTHGRHGLPHALLGSVAEKVVRLSPIPVMTVRAAPAAA
jgi:nucleotide-binding universal stress UspA family protein